MELGDPVVGRTERGRLDLALDAFDIALNDVIETVETGGLDQLTANQKVEWWQRFETSRNRLPLIDHNLIADAEATDLPETYCSSTLTRFLVQVLQHSPVKPPPEYELLQLSDPGSRCSVNNWSRCCRALLRCNAQVW
jgi:hypothetical protein